MSEEDKQKETEKVKRGLKKYVTEYCSSCEGFRGNIACDFAMLRACYIGHQIERLTAVIEGVVTSKKQEE